MATLRVNVPDQLLTECIEAMAPIYLERARQLDPDFDTRVDAAQLSILLTVALRRRVLATRRNAAAGSAADSQTEPAVTPDTT